MFCFVFQSNCSYDALFEQRLSLDCININKLNCKLCFAGSHAISLSSGEKSSHFGSSVPRGWGDTLPTRLVFKHVLSPGSCWHLHFGSCRLQAPLGRWGGPGSWRWARHSRAWVAAESLGNSRGAQGSQFILWDFSWLWDRTGKVRLSSLQSSEAPPAPLLLAQTAHRHGNNLHRRVSIGELFLDL